MITITLIKLREWYIHIFKKKILLIEKDEEFISDKVIIIPLNLFYFFFIKDLLKINKINLVYKLDDLIFYDNNKDYKITINQIMIEFNIIDPQNLNNKIEFIQNINKYSKNMPFYIIAKIENIDTNLMIQIKLLNICKIITKEYIIDTILNKYLYELLL
jgi:hypothetical protein